MNRTETQALPSVIHGIPLDEEQGLGALTLPGYLREVTTRYAQREALVMHEANGTTRWCTAELRSEERRIGKGCVNTCKSRLSRYPSKHKHRQNEMSIKQQRI